MVNGRLIAVLAALVGFVLLAGGSTTGAYWTALSTSSSATARSRCRTTCSAS
jgi:hypothetical protein